MTSLNNVVRIVLVPTLAAALPGAAVAQPELRDRMLLYRAPVNGLPELVRHPREADTPPPAPV